MSDLNSIHELHSLPETDQYNTLGIPENISVTEKLLNTWLAEQNASPRPSYIFCVETSDNQQFTGLIAVRMGKINYRSAEVWFKTHKDFWAKGYTTEALKRLLKFCFDDLQLHRIEAGCAVENLASKRVLEKAGMICEGRKRKILPIRGEWIDNYFFSILEEDFK